MLPTNARYQVPVFADGINYRIVSQTSLDVVIQDIDGNRFTVSPLNLVMVV
jgi:hypothetical protein